MIKTLAYAALAVSLSLVGGCLYSGKEGGAGSGPADIHLTLRQAALTSGAAQAPPPVVDSIAIRMTGPDIAPLEFKFTGDSLGISLANLPAGTGRSISAALFKHGRLLYLGSTLCDLPAGKKTELSLRCDPQFSRVSARFHIPLAYLQRLTGGTLDMAGDAETFRAAMALKGEFGSFFLDELPGNARYNVALTLDSAGRSLFHASQTGVFLPLGEVANWDLPLTADGGSLGIPSGGGGSGGGTGNPVDTVGKTVAATGIGIELQPAKETVVSPGFPAGKRRPAQPGEAILSEFYAAPATKDSSTEGEWWEVFNRTADTLLLDSCRLSQGRSEAVTKSYKFSAGQTLPPGRAMTFGRQAARTNAHYQDFTLVNTSATLLLLCAQDALVLDSLKYSATAADSTVAVRIRDGLVSSLNPDRMGQSALPTSWCQTKMGGPDSTGVGWASPGTIAQNCPE